MSKKKSRAAKYVWKLEDIEIEEPKKEKKFKKFKKVVYKGGSGSGNFGHSGRPGKVGGSGVGNLVPITAESLANAKVGDLHVYYSKKGNPTYGTLVKQNADGSWQVGIHKKRSDPDSKPGSSQSKLSSQFASESEFFVERGNAEEPKQTTESYTTARGGVIHKIPANEEIPASLVKKIQSDPDAEGMVRFTYNTATNNLHVAEKGMFDVDHGDFIVAALEGNEPPFSEYIQVRGILDVNAKKMSIYNYANQPELFSDSGLNTTIVQKKLDRNMDRIYRNLPKIGGVEVDTELIPLEDIGL